MAVSIETSVFVALLAFISGFFTNLMAMRKMFVSQAEFEELKKIRNSEIEKRQLAHEKRLEEIVKLIQTSCELKRANCAPFATELKAIRAEFTEDLKEIKADVKELFREIRKILCHSGNNVSGE